ncbi:BCL-2-associated athanogene 5 [Panicum miliaceum]|uniref:BCL-2-associated athanogene 5 n=1 Tax=Panicum miliaceum TaxID=4540 RepID=A0A3L6PXF1_PANMI|nr:BCL-2-associated athanogene 5 [Panicum miliaceum]
MASEVIVQEDESEVTADMADESAAATDVPDAVERCGEIEAKTMADTAAEMEVDMDRADAEPEEAEETEQAQDARNLIDGNKQEGSDVEGEWETVTEEPEPAAAPASLFDAPRPQEPAEAEILTTETEAGAGGLDKWKSAQQCAAISALAERVDVLERAVRRAKDAEPAAAGQEVEEGGEGKQPREVLQLLSRRI